jgi:hypothetical protein
MNRKNQITYGIGVVVMLACLSISLAACSLPTFGGQASVKKPTPISTTSGNSATGADATSTSTTGGELTGTPTVSSSAKQCGTINYQQAGNNMGPILAESANNDAQQVASCFLQAFQQCVPASIDMNVSRGAASINPLGVGNGRMFSTKLLADGGAASLYHFTISSQSGGSCVVSEVEQVYSVVAPTPPTPQTCAQVEQTGTDLRFVDCGNAGTITFPLVQATPTP